MDEEWRDVPTWEGQYQVSNYGRVKSMARNIPRSDGRPMRKPEKIMRLQLRTTGYWGLILKLGDRRESPPHSPVGVGCVRWSPSRGLDRLPQRRQ